MGDTAVFPILAMLYVVVVCFNVGGNLLSHTLPGAVPSARAGLASGFGMGNRAFPCRYFHRQTCGSPIPGATGVMSDTAWWTRDTHVVCLILLLRYSRSTFLVTWRYPHPIVFCVLVCWCNSTSSLTFSVSLQVWPINPIVCREPQQKPHLKTGFPLRCVQRLCLPYVANQPCSWRNNWHTRGTSVPVLSY